MCTYEDLIGEDHLVFAVLKGLELAASFADWSAVYQQVIVGRLWPLLSKKTYASIVIQLIGNPSHPLSFSY
jgi:hypothetical protein